MAKVMFMFCQVDAHFVESATFIFSAFGRANGSFWTCDPALAIKKGRLRICNGRWAPSRPFSMGMPIALGSLPISCLADGH